MSRSVAARASRSLSSCGQAAGKGKAIYVMCLLHRTRKFDLNLVAASRPKPGRQGPQASSTAELPLAATPARQLCVPRCVPARRLFAWCTELAQTARMQHSTATVAGRESRPQGKSGAMRHSVGEMRAGAAHGLTASFFCACCTESFWIFLFSWAAMSRFRRSCSEAGWRRSRLRAHTRCGGVESFWGGKGPLRQKRAAAGLRAGYRQEQQAAASRRRCQQGRPESRPAPLLHSSY